MASIPIVKIRARLPAWLLQRLDQPLRQFRIIFDQKDFQPHLPAPEQPRWAVAISFL
ncbi:hypothetical protein AGR3A_Lc130363 [Agrobacterium tomkonis CFBP 6623]|uniref:Uncharacterized protein n=1 Tax=Agrobacterium tomkonis CFBP 6623 TaxID=1183432 RepID=A0A1S7RER6_9HYPH|nr:hypothetical protein AGR3A_Lc130363 [Agrobacterium tomkonis CFBP 6623]